MNSSATDIIVDINESDISTFQSYDTVEIKKQKEAVVNYSSSDSSNILNTSTLCLEMSHSFFNDSNNSDLVKSNNIPESSETEKKINIVSVENVDNILTAKLNEKKYCELYSNDSVKRCNKNDVLPLKETKKYSQNVNQIVTFNECSNIPNTSFCKLGLDISKSACAPVMAFDLPTSQSTDIAPLDTVSPTSYTDIKALALPVSSCTAIEIETLCTDHATPRGDNKALGLHSSPSLLDFVPTTSCADIMYMDIPKAHSPDISVLDIVPATSCTDGMNVDSPVSLAADIPVQVIVPETACDEISDSSSLKKLGTLNLPTPSSSNTNKNRMPDIKKSRKRKCIQELPKLKKEHIDFISDDECYDKLNVAQGEDFSSGSSDLWSGKESDNMSSSNSENDPKHTKPTNKRKKLQKKRNIDKPLEGTVQFKKRKVENKRKIRRMKREKGDSYETSSGKLVEKKTLKANPCEPTKCPRNCFEITEERRQSIFDYFWNLNSQRKKDWLVQCALRVPVNRPKKGVIDSKRKFTYEYYINEGEGRRQVCQKFILKTLDIGQNYLLYTIGNVQEGLSQAESRKKSSNPKYDESVIASAKHYIESLPYLPSHYCRKKSSKLYLPQEYKNTTNLYRLYKKKCEENQENYLGERKFKDFFKTEYNNVTVHVPKKDKCKICTKYENDHNENKVNMDSEIIKAHIEEKEATYERFKCHQSLHLIDKETIVSSFDLQKVLNTPHGDNILLYYTRKFTVFNFTIYESSTQNGFCYTWGECDGKRGAKEIGSCIYKYLQNVDERGIKKVIFYCDCCSGQNRNKTILSIFKGFLTVSKNIEVIQINYLLPGHSYMPVDSMHSVIEREVRKIIVWSPTQWSSYIESARKNPRPYNVNVLEFTDFIDWDTVTQECFSNCTKELNTSKIRIATMKKKDVNTFTTKHSMKPDATTHEIKLFDNYFKPKGKGVIKGKGKGKGKGKLKEKDTAPSASNETLEIKLKKEFQQLKPLYKKRLAISEIKYKDLTKLCNDGVIPSRYHGDFTNLPYAKKIQDTLNQTDEDDSSVDSV